MQKNQDQGLSNSFQEDYFRYLTMAIGGLPWTEPGREQTPTDRQRETSGIGPMQTVEAAADF